MKRKRVIAAPSISDSGLLTLSKRVGSALVVLIEAVGLFDALVALVDVKFVHTP